MGCKLSVIQINFFTTAFVIVLKVILRWNTENHGRSMNNKFSKQSETGLVANTLTECVKLDRLVTVVGWP